MTLKKIFLISTGLFLLISCIPKKENIFKAIDRNSIRQVKKIVEMYPDVIEMQIDEKDNSIYDTILYYAVNRGNTDEKIIEYLVLKSQEKRLNIPIFNSFTTSLFNMDLKLCDLFIGMGLDINTSPTSIPIASNINFYNENINALKYIIGKGLDFNLYNDPHPPLYDAAQYGYTEVVRLMIEAGADVNIKNYNGVTPLAVAIDYNRIEVIELLLKAGAETELDVEGIIQPIARIKSKEVIDLLLKYGIDINEKDSDGFGCVFGLLLSSSDFRDNDLIETLKYAIKMGADRNYETNDGDTPLNYAIKRGYSQEIIDLLKGK